MKNSTWLGFPVILAAALVVTVSGAGWVETAGSTVAAHLLLRLGKKGEVPGWLSRMQEIWSLLLAGQVLCWFATIWPGFGMWPSLGLLILALWQVGKGDKAVRSATSVLGLFQLALIGGVLAAGVQSLRIRNLHPEIPGINGWLLTILLLPALGRDEERRSLWPGIWALVISAITQGVVPAGTENGNAFWEMSKSITVFGKIRRLESLAAAGLSLGFYTLLCALLGGGEKRVSGKSLIFVAGAFLAFCARGSLPGIWAVAVSILLWIIMPLFATERMGNRKKTEQSEEQ